MKLKLRKFLVVSLSLFLLGSCFEADVADSEDSNQLSGGKLIVDANCVVCHSNGINGAPILGNKKMWDKRAAQGEDVLVQHAMEGFAMDMMPAKGGNPDLTEEEIRMAVQYMLSLVE